MLIANTNPSKCVESLLNTLMTNGIPAKLVSAAMMVINIASIVVR